MLILPSIHYTVNLTSSRSLSSPPWRATPFSINFRSKISLFFHALRHQLHSMCAQPSTGSPAPRTIPTSIHTSPRRQCTIDKLDAPRNTYIHISPPAIALRSDLLSSIGGAEGRSYSRGNKVYIQRGAEIYVI